MKVVILAGGNGTRLWPLSRDSFPKQFLKLQGDLSLLQQTIARFLPCCSPADFLIVTSPDYIDIAVSQVRVLDPLLEKRILLEPERRNTGPAVLLAIKYLQEIDKVGENETILVTPSDHLIDPEDTFLNLLSLVHAQVEGSIVMFGVFPTSPDPGFGYLKISDCLFEDGASSFFKVEQFIEKPNVPIAIELVKSGKYLWNSGLFAFRMSHFLDQIEKHSLELGRGVQQSYEQLKEGYSELPEVSIDISLMEKSSNLIVLPIQLLWSDLGSWDRLFAVMEKDMNRNVKIGNVQALQTTDSFIYGGKRLVSTIGLEKIILVETEDVLFVAKQGESHRVKELLEAFKLTPCKEAPHHNPHKTTTVRSWGQYDVLEEGARFKVKRLVVYPGKRLSLQRHYHRSEHWIVVKGTAKVSIGIEEKMVHENESVYVPKSTVHRLENPGKVVLEIIEVQVGEYTGEDDIVRLEN